ncbi:hypothetical protein BPOR_0439g00070 [Botrytis porri]|uniref:Uncharacterized protein n=1 Tax=Botrytis porri TaxID=87229 RepID=A0A4Z1KHK2_9HELO|nr:hypothetical protein BPOR_0439g00070 [Botrytis porri]
MTTPGSRQSRRDAEHAKTQANLYSKVNGGNQRSSYPSSRHSNGDSSGKNWDIHDKVKRAAAQLNPSDSTDNTGTERRLYDRHARSQEGRSHKTSGTKDQTDLSGSKRKK